MKKPGKKEKVTQSKKSYRKPAVQIEKFVASFYAEWL